MQKPLSPETCGEAADYILATRGLAKNFGGFTAVAGVDLKVRRGATHALIGPNGAGKTTVFNLLTKFLSPTSGTIAFNGRDVTALSPTQIAQIGISRSFQISAVFGTFTVIDNVKVALQKRLGREYHFWKSHVSLNELDDRAMRLLEMVGLQSRSGDLAAELPYGQKRSLEIATTVALEPKLMLLDEPMSGLGREDIERVTALIGDISRTCTVLMVEHNLPVVSRLADFVTVLVRGNVLAEGTYGEIAANEQVLDAYMGKKRGGHA